MTTPTDIPADASEEDLAVALQKLRSSLPATASDMLDEVSELLEGQSGPGKRSAKDITTLQLIAASYLALKSRH